jgi:hypothetical protein
LDIAAPVDSRILAVDAAVLLEMLASSMLASILALVVDASD